MPHYLLLLLLFLTGTLCLICIVCQIYDAVKFGASVSIQEDIFHGLLGTEAALLCLFLVCRLLLKNTERKLAGLAPFVLKLPYADEAGMLDALHARLPLNVLNDHILYAHLPGRRRIELFFIGLEDFTSQNFYSSKDLCLRLAASKANMKRSATRSELVSTAFLHVFLLDNLSETALAYIRQPVDQFVLGLELDVILDLKNMQLLIPGCICREPSPAALYAYCVRKLVTWSG